MQERPGKVRKTAQDPSNDEAASTTTSTTYLPAPNIHPIRTRGFWGGPTKHSWGSVSQNTGEERGTGVPGAFPSQNLATASLTLSKMECTFVKGWIGTHCLYPISWHRVTMYNC